jgi:hypothetical protein
MAYACVITRSIEESNKGSLIYVERRLRQVHGGQASTNGISQDGALFGTGGPGYRRRKVSFADMLADQGVHAPIILGMHSSMPTNLGKRCKR